MISNRIPSAVRKIPTIRFSVFPSAPVAILVAIFAQKKVNTVHRINRSIWGGSLRTKLLTAPVSAEKVIINTLVPTAVFSSYPSTMVKSISIIIPPPAPKKPQISPMMEPQTRLFAA